MKDQTLESVDEKLVTTGKFLDNITSDSKKLECLDCFVRCQEVIVWLRNVTKGMQVKKQFCDDLMHVTLSVICSLVCEVFGCIGL